MENKNTEPFQFSKREEVWKQRNRQWVFLSRLEQDRREKWPALSEDLFTKKGERCPLFIRIVGPATFFAFFTTKKKSDIKNSSLNRVPNRESGMDVGFGSTFSD